MLSRFLNNTSTSSCVVSRSKLTVIGGVMNHRVELQIQEVEARQGRDGGKGIVVHQAVSRQVELPARTEE